MMRQAIFFSVFLILVGSGIALSGETETAVLPPSEAVVGAEPAADDSSAIQARDPQKRHNRYAVVKEDARSQIAGVLAEIHALEDRGDEPELQREIERIKLDAEIARLQIVQQDANQKGDRNLIQEIEAEIGHLMVIDEPVIGVPQEQPAQ